MAVALVAMVATLCLPYVNAAPPLTTTRPMVVSATNQTPSYVGIGPVGTSKLLQLYQGSNERFAVNSNGIPTPFQYGATITTADGSVTQAFTITYSSAPTVISRQKGTGTSTTNIVTVTTSNFVLRTSVATQTNDFIAIGPP